MIPYRNAGALVISKATGRRSAIIAIPVEVQGRVAGAVGVSFFLDALSEQIDTALELRPGVGFFALAPNGVTTLHRNTDRHFPDPRELGSETLRAEANEMLAETSGKTTYGFDNVTKPAMYRTWTVTGCKHAITFTASR